MNINTLSQCTLKLSYMKMCEVYLAHVLIIGWNLLLCKIIHLVSCYFLSGDDEVSYTDVAKHLLKHYDDGLGDSVFFSVVS